VEETVEQKGLKRAETSENEYGTAEGFCSLMVVLFHQLLLSPPERYGGLCSVIHARSRSLFVFCHIIMEEVEIPTGFWDCMETLKTHEKE